MITNKIVYFTNIDVYEIFCNALVPQKVFHQLIGFYWEAIEMSLKDNMIEYIKN